MRYAVLIYSLPGYLRCRQARRFLTRNRTPFREINVLTHPKVLGQVYLGCSEVLPIIAVGPKTIKGWNRRELLAALEFEGCGSRSDQAEPGDNSPRLESRPPLNHSDFLAAHSANTPPSGPSNRQPVPTRAY